MVKIIICISFYIRINLEEIKIFFNLPRIRIKIILTFYSERYDMLFYVNPPLLSQKQTRAFAVINFDFFYDAL